MGTIDIEESPELSRAQVFELENVVEVDSEGNPPFYVAISQLLDKDQGWLSTAPKPVGSGTDLDTILANVWMSFEARREFPSPHTMRWHVYRLEPGRSWLVQKFEVFGDDDILLDHEAWMEEQDAKKEAKAKAAAVRERRAGMRVVGSEVP